MNRTSASRFGGEKTTTILSVCRKLVDRRRVELRLDACKATVFPSYSQPISRYSHAGHTVMRVSQRLVGGDGLEPSSPLSESGMLPIALSTNRKWRRMTGSNSCPFETVRCSRPVADHSAPLSVVVDVGIEPTRCANLALSEVYKSSLHPVLSTKENWYLWMDSNHHSSLIRQASCRWTTKI